MKKYTYSGQYLTAIFYAIKHTTYMYFLYAQDY